MPLAVLASSRENKILDHAKAQRTPSRKEIPVDENDIARETVDAALQVHKALGPGLLESVYEVVLAQELCQRGLEVERQVAVPIVYQNLVFEEGFRADLMLNRKVLVEIKSVERLAPVHKKQLLTYLRLSGLKLGLLINFNEALLKDGITRIVNGL